MTDNSNRYGSEPLGKSVEEIEQDSGNRINPSVGGEEVRHTEDRNLVVPAIINGNQTGVPAVVNSHALVDHGGGADDDAHRGNRDTSE